MRGDFQFSKDNYPFRVDTGIVHSKSAELFLVIDQRTQEVLLETYNADEAVTFHTKKRDEYYARDVGRAAVVQQELQDTSDRNAKMWRTRDQSEDRYGY
jgi:hypothetical protein